MDNAIGKRLMELIYHYHLNKNSLSVRLGLPSNSVITKIVNSPERGISLKIIQKILAEFPQINPRWFILGEGEMLGRGVVMDEVSEEQKLYRANCQQCVEKDKEIAKLKSDFIELQKQYIDHLKELQGTKKISSG